METIFNGMYFVVEQQLGKAAGNVIFWQKGYAKRATTLESLVSKSNLLLPRGRKKKINPYLREYAATYKVDCPSKVVSKKSSAIDFLLLTQDEIEALELELNEEKAIDLFTRLLSSPSLSLDDVLTP